MRAPRRRTMLPALLVVPPLLVLPLAGCAGSPSAPASSAPPASTSAPASSPAAPSVRATPSGLPSSTLSPPPSLGSDGPQAIPAAKQPGEFARSVLRNGKTTVTPGPFPSSGDIALKAACTGPSGTEMRYTVLNGKGKQDGESGSANCGTGGTSSRGPISNYRTKPKQLKVRLTADDGVTSGYVILTNPTD